MPSTMFLKTLALLVTLGVAAALRPNDTTICDYYTPLVLSKENSAASQQELMALITHTFILGNYTTPNVGVKVDGVAAPATFEGHKVNLLPYFTGGYVSTNRGGKAVMQNFLDDGGATALLANMPASGTTSNQYHLLTHVYQYFGEFYGCSMQGSTDFPKYQGAASMWEVHKFMDLNYYEAAYFNEQIVLAGKSVGFEDADVEYTRVGLDKTFTYRCAPPAAVIPASAGPQLQVICADVNTCPLAQDANCSAYPNGGVRDYPAIANVTLLGGVPKENDTIGLSSASASGSSATATGSSSSSPSSPTSGPAAPPSASHTGAAAYMFGTGIPMAVTGAMVFLLSTALAL